MADANEKQAAPGSNGFSNPAGASAAVLADPFNRKVESHLGDRVILKPLTRWNEAYKEFPRYVMEYLVSRYVDAEEPVAGQRKIDKILSEHYTESAKKELIKSRIKENGEYTLLGQLTVRLDQARDHYWADVPALGDNTVRVGPKILEQYRDVLMTSGAWGTMVIEYDATYEIKSRKYPFYVREFTPLQYTRLDLDDYIAKRPLFTEREWLDLLVQSIGFNPARFDRRVKMLMLLRLVPFVEANYNLIELGDEIASTRFEDAEASVSVLKDYMQTGKFTRGDQEFSAQCSVVLGGNIDTDVARREPEPRYRHLFEVLPIELQDAAFLDRIHAYLPGWEMPKIRPENYAAGYGFLTDYMAEIFSELRRRNFQTHVVVWVDLSGMTGRNQDAIKKTVAGLLKLLHPHRSPETLTRKEITPLVEIAVEMRERVTDQLAKMLPAEFGSVDYRYTLTQA
jgi:ATP-dependent Lon protease